jgi:hypothetical protein
MIHVFQLNVMMCILTPFFVVVVVVFMVSVPMGYIYSGRGTLVLGRLIGGDRDLFPLFLFVVDERML